MQNSQKFGNKRLQEYNKLRTKKVYSTSIIRIKFPDGLILQGKFGAREKISALYSYVKECIFEKDRDFVLYRAPPKKDITELNQSMMKAELVPSSMIFFQWKDEDLVASSKVISLDMKKLKDKLSEF